MMELLKKLFGIGPETDYKELIRNGAVIIDVRTKGEYQGGHIKGSLNIPLDTLNAQILKLSKEKVIITCCASGMRSASAKGILQSNGIEKVYNGGGWLNLQSKIS
jgi:phage shock protein E